MFSAVQNSASHSTHVDASLFQIFGSIICSIWKQRNKTKFGVTLWTQTNLSLSSTVLLNLVILKLTLEGIKSETSGSSTLSGSKLILLGQSKWV